MFLPDQGFPFWSALSELQQEQVRNHTVIRQFLSGEYQKKIPGYYWVYEGDIALLSCHSSGRRRSILEARDYETLLLTKSFLSDIRGIHPELYARKESEVWFIPRESIRALGKIIPEMYDFIIELLSDQMAAMAIGISARMEKDISRRLCIYMLRNYTNRQVTSITTSHEDLAEILGTTREAVTRNIHILKDAGIVVTGRNKISFTDIEALKGYINQETED